MTTKISIDNIQQSTLDNLGGAPTVSSIQITDSSYTVIDDTAIKLTGGYARINGTRFVSGCQVYVNQSLATSVSFVSSVLLEVQMPASSAGTYNVYVVNPDGSFAIRINGVTYSSEPIWVTSSTLPAQMSNVSLSIQLEATGATSYQLQAGSTLPSGLTLSSSGLLSGTITVTVNTDYNFTIEALDAELQESPRAFSISITAGDEYWDTVTGLLVTNSRTYDTDLSANNFNISVNGPVRPGKFNPYETTYYGVYLDGNGDDIRYTGTAVGTNQYSFECWFNAVSLTSRGVLGTTASNGLNIRIINSTTISVDLYQVNATNFTVPTMISGSWNHLVVCRNAANQTTVFLNGVRSTTGAATITSNYSGVSNIIGSQTDTSNFQGQISNVRLIVGSTAYDPTQSTITVPTSPLQTVTNTALLICQNNRFIDNSTNNYTITLSGDPKITGYSPFTVPSQYDNYGSAYFDGGNSCYLQTATDLAAFGFSTGDFTIETWVYAISTDSYIFFDTRKQNEAKINLGMASSGTKVQVAVGSTAIITSSSSFPLNSWLHVAVVRVSGTATLYINGVSNGTASMTTDLGSTGSWCAGTAGDARGDANYDYSGYISDMRVVKGTAIYTSNFTPPTQPLTAITNTVLLTCQGYLPADNNQIIDESDLGQIATRNGNPVTGSVNPYGDSWSCYFDGTGDYLSPAYAAIQGLTNQNFTIEAWVFPTKSATQMGIINNWQTGGAFILYFNSTGRLAFQFTDAASGVSTKTLTGTTTSVVANQWTHVAVVRTTTTIRIYVNGVADATTYNIGTGTIYYYNGTAKAIKIGTAGDTSSLFTGFISNVRMTIGTALYTTNFTPSRTAMQPLSGTVLLACNTYTLIDSSPTQMVMTKNGDVTVNRFSPFATLPPPDTIYYSGFFDGTGDYLSMSMASNSAFSIPTNTTPFTIECWLYPTGTAAQQYYIFMDQYTGSGNPINICVELANGASMDTSGLYPMLGYYNGSSWTVSAAGNTIVPINRWSHVAWVFTGSTTKVYLNGTDITAASPTPATTWGGLLNSNGNDWYIGKRWDSTGVFQGCISNLRFVKGTAVYTGNFTPPTSPLTAITNTVLLTCQNSTFVDNSPSNLTLTSFGEARPIPASPFTVTSATESVPYSLTTFSGSMYFDGNDYYEIPTGVNGTTVFGTNAFTIEFWCYNTTATTTTWNPIMAIGAGTAGQEIRISQNINNTGYGILYPTNTNNGNTYTGLGTLPINQWHHFALVRSGSTLSFYRNGIRVIQNTSATFDFTNTGPIRIGYGFYSSDGYFTGGYISNLRIVNGTAMYLTSSFSPSVSPVTKVAKTGLLINGIAAIYDAGVTANFETAGNTSATLSVKKFTNTSMYFDGTGDYLSATGGIATSSSCAFGTGNFTVEFWVYPTSASGTQQIIDTRPAGTASTSRYFAIGYVSGAVNYYTAGASPAISGGTLNVSNWHHIAVVRSSNVTKMYVNGTQVGSNYTDSQDYISGINRPILGSDGNVPTSSYFIGYVDNLRISKGFARYTSNFTAPATPFPNQ